METTQEVSGYKRHPTALIPEGEARAHLGGISRATMLRLRQRGELKCVRIGRRVLFRVADLDDYVERKADVS